MWFSKNTSLAALLLASVSFDSVSCAPVLPRSDLSVRSDHPALLFPRAYEPSPAVRPYSEAGEQQQQKLTESLTSPPAIPNSDSSFTSLYKPQNTDSKSWSLDSIGNGLDSAAMCKASGIDDSSSFMNWKTMSDPAGKGLPYQHQISTDGKVVMIDNMYRKNDFHQADGKQEGMSAADITTYLTRMAGNDPAAAGKVTHFVQRDIVEDGWSAVMADIYKANGIKGIDDNWHSFDAKSPEGIALGGTNNGQVPQRFARANQGTTKRTVDSYIVNKRRGYMVVKFSNA